MVNGLIRLGMPKPEAISMIARGAARRIRKSLPIGVDDRPLPTVDTSEADKRREELRREQDKPASGKSVKPKQKETPKIGGKRIVLKQKPRKGDTRPTSPFVSITEKLNGKKFMRVIGADGKVTIKQIDQYHVPTYVETLAGDEKTEDKKMEKSQRFEQLVEMARTAPEKLTAGTRAAVNSYLAKNGKPQITIPVPAQPWFRQPTLREVAARREAIAANAPVRTPVAGPGFKQSRMTTHEIQQHRLEQALSKQQ